MSAAPEAAIDSASTRALLLTYCASSNTTRVESTRNSDVFGENHRSMDRFIRPKLNRNMHTAGISAISAAPSTIRVRSRAPTALPLWSAYSFRMFLNSSIDSSISSRNTSTVRPVNTSVSPEVWGLRKPTLEVLNACSVISKAKSSSTPLASRVTRRRRGLPLNSMGRL